jgi:hypothetical protein
MSQSRLTLNRTTRRCGPEGPEDTILREKFTYRCVARERAVVNLFPMTRPDLPPPLLLPSSCVVLIGLSSRDRVRFPWSVITNQFPYVTQFNPEDGDSLS